MEQTWKMFVKRPHKSQMKSRYNQNKMTYPSNIMVFGTVKLILFMGVQMIWTKLCTYFMTYKYLWSIYWLRTHADGILSTHQVSNISRTLVGNKIVDHSDVVGA